MISHSNISKGYIFSDSRRLQMSLAKLGKPRSAETKRKIGLSNKGKKRSNEILIQMSLRATGEKNPMFGKSAWLGKTHSEETKRKIRESVTKYMLTHHRKFNEETQIERDIKNELIVNQITYIAQYPIPTTRYAVDFFIPSANLIVECDGCRYHACIKCGHTYFEQRRERDAARTAELEELGYRIIRFWEHDIESSLDACIKMILDSINT